MASFKKFDLDLNATEFKYMKGNCQKQFTVYLKFTTDIYSMHLVIITLGYVKLYKKIIRLMKFLCYKSEL